MNGQVTITIPNLDKIKAVFDRAPKKTVLAVDQAIRKSLVSIENKTKREAPVNKQSGGGQLRQSIEGRMIGLGTGVVEVGVDYGIFVEEGTRPHTIVAKNKKALANTRTGQFFGRVVQHPGTKANRFFQRGIDNAMGDVSSYFTKALESVFKE